MVPPLLLGDPNEAIDAPKLFISAFQQALNNRRRQQALEFQYNRLQEQMVYKDRELQVRDAWAGQRHQADMDKLDMADQRLKDSDYWRSHKADLDDRIADIREKTLNLNAEKAKQSLADQAQKIDIARRNFFVQQVAAHGFRDASGKPLVQAFDRTEIEKDPNADGWHKDPSKPDYRFYRRSYIDPTSGKPVPLMPVTIREDDFQRLADQVKEMKENPLSSLDPSVTSPPVAPTTFVRDPTTGKLVPQ
jgi:hypothetical protein